MDVEVFIFFYKPTISDEVFKIISKEWNVNGNVCEVLDKKIEYTNKHKKTKENEYHSQIKVYRDINQEERTIYINKKFGKLTKHKKIQKLNL